MPAIQTSRTDAAQADPARLLDDLYGRRVFKKTPVLIIDQETLPVTLNGESFHDYLIAKLDARERDPANDQPESALRRQFRRAAATVMGDGDSKLRRYITFNSARILETMDEGNIQIGRIQPATLPIHGFFGGTPKMAFVSAPPRNYPLYTFLNATKVFPMRGVLQDVTPAEVSYSILAHELAHAAGANEAQADAVAALMTRRAFPDTKMPQVMGDMRALDIIDCVAMAQNAFYMMLCGGQVRYRLRTYGQDTVRANDEIAAMPHEQIARMSEAEIFRKGFSYTGTGAPDAQALGNKALSDFSRALQSGTQQQPVAQNVEIFNDILVKLGQDSPEGQTIRRYTRAAHNFGYVY